MSKPIRQFRNFIAIAHDGIIAGASFIFALYLRWSDQMWVYAADYWLQGALICAGLMMTLSVMNRSYRRLWRYVSLKDIGELVKIACVTLLLFYVGAFLLTRLDDLPRSIPVIHALVFVALLCAPRFLYRALHERRLQLPVGRQVPVLLVGAGQEAELFIRESLRNPSFSYRVVGVAASDEKMAGRNIHHVRVYGPLKDIPAILRKLKRKDCPAHRIILADPHLDGAAIRDILAAADEQGITIARVPKLTDLTRGDRDKFDVKPIDVEDILGRPQAQLDRDAMKQVIADKVVLITGSGGSIGSELVRQIAAMEPKRLVLFEQGEYNLYAIDRELQEKFPNVARKAILGDVRDEDCVNNVFADHQPSVVFHAAALKHVPLCEINIEEAILTNIMGTRVVADACVEHKVELMVQVSTDKAVNPTNIMGACKRVGESYAQALGQNYESTRFITVRFGNVLGSTGSVVPLFEHQLHQGGPLTVTHKEMTRYFMTIREAVQLVIQAAALGVAQQEQAAPIYVLDMGEPIKIEDLALQMIRLAGLRPHADITINYTGLRPGEKLHEELFYDSEPLHDTEHSGIHLAQAREVVLKTFVKKLDQIAKAAHKRDVDAALALLKELAPDYQPEKSNDIKKVG